MIWLLYIINLITTCIALREHYKLLKFREILWKQEM